MLRKLSWFLTDVRLMPGSSAIQTASPVRSGRPPPRARRASHTGSQSPQERFCRSPRLGLLLFCELNTPSFPSIFSQATPVLGRPSWPARRSWRCPGLRPATASLLSLCVSRGWGGSEDTVPVICMTGVVAEANQGEPGSGHSSQGRFLRRWQRAAREAEENWERLGCPVGGAQGSSVCLQLTG